MTLTSRDTAASLQQSTRATCWVICVATLSSLGAFLFGLDIGYIGPILECQSFKRDVIHLPDWQSPSSKISSATVGFIVGVFSIGCMVMSFPPISSYFLDSWGRKGSIMLGSAVFISGCLVQVRAGSLLQIYVGRFLAGCSIGLLSTVVALYQSEVAPPAMRGSLTSLYQFMITCGILAAAGLDVLLLDAEDGWRLAILVQVFPAGLLLAGMAFLPRSPRWLVQQRRNQEALQVLLSIREESEARKELHDIATACKDAEEGGDVMWSEMFKGRTAQLLAIGISLQLLQQLVGMNAFMYFGPRLFRSLGLSENKFQALNNAVNCAATLPALYLADKCGRRSLLISSALGMSTACFVMGATGEAFVAREHGNWITHNVSITIVIVAMVFGFVINFAYGWGPMVWVYCAEIFPLRVRSRCIGLTTMSNWVGNFLVAQFTPALLESTGFGTFFVFGTFSLIALALAMWLPETKGVLLENIDELFDRKLGSAATIKSKAQWEVVPTPVGLDLSKRDQEESVLMP
eukprot:TRINITY_DN12971_c0_g1_i1.p1 TRINITY_DN12971_c0_g1~~TRINITY_DN12971_c0_g1_i1.p1  ORF type:complete len:519 (-),score=95.48 TRINITY_DN12971_c0_g1_i1:67-1623(-)